LKKTVVVFAPHPDDETLGCGGTIAKRISEGFEVITVLMTDGRHAFSEASDQRSRGLELADPTPEEVKEIRSAEFDAATAILGVLNENRFKLDFEDSRLEKHEKEAEDKIAEIVGRYSPEEVYFPFPRDCNPDHQAANRIVKRVVQRLGLSCVKYQYSITHKYARVGPWLERILSLFRRNTVKADVADFLHLKKRALDEYKLEKAIVSEMKGPLHGRMDSFLKGKETFYVCR
jgi:LmbE family N-acetylglucosaminyl deacetylase